MGMYVQPLLLPIKGIAGDAREFGGSFVASVIAHCAKTGNFTLCASEAMEYVIQYQWDAFGLRFFMRNLTVGLLSVLCFTLNGLVFLDTFAPGGPWDASSFSFETSPRVSFGLCAAMALVWLLDVAREVEGLIGSGGLRPHLKSIWNQLDIATLALTGGVLGAQLVAFVDADAWGMDPPMLTSSARGLAAFDTMRHLQALAYPLVFLRLLYYFQGFKASGVLVRMIIGIVSGVNIFMGILLIVTAGFSLAFLTMFRHQALVSMSDADVTVEHADESPWSELDTAFISSYQLMLGSFSRELSGHRITVILFVIFTYFINIVMLNLLIALMGDLYDAVQETAYPQYLAAKGQLVLEAEAALRHYTLSADRKKECFPTWLQVLVPRKQAVTEKTWSGKVAEVKSDLGVVKGMVESVRAALTVQQKEVETHRKEMKEHLTKLEDMIASLTRAQLAGEGSVSQHV